MLWIVHIISRIIIFYNIKYKIKILIILKLKVIIVSIKSNILLHDLMKIFGEADISTFVLISCITT